MKTHIGNRVRNINLRPGKCLLPLFEAITNSIQAIDDAKNPHGKIEVRLQRDASGVLVDGGKPMGDPPIGGFDIVDNGIGFDDANMKAFDEADTPYKIQRGGKGVGRFTFLCAFDHAEVKSVYAKDSTFRCRRFEFLVSASGYRNMKDSDTAETGLRTSVRLVGFKPDFKSRCPRTAEAIARHICSHFLDYLSTQRCPAIWLIDPSPDTRIKLNDFFRREFVLGRQTTRFRLKGAGFALQHVRLCTTAAKKHLISLCANRRPVITEPLDAAVTFKTEPLVDENGDEFFYSALVSGSVLDEAVTADRTQFNLDGGSSEEPKLIDDLSITEIRDAAAGKVREYLQQFTASLRDAHERRLERLCGTDPRFRALLKHKRLSVLSITPSLSDDQVEIELYKLYRDWKLELLRRNQQLSKQPSQQSAEYAEFRKDFDHYLDEANEIAFADLAVYVVDRRAALSFLEASLRIKDNDKFAREDAIHQIIFPLKKTSDDVPFEQSNLWIIDERLAFHRYLASDKEFATHEPLDSHSTERPDIAAYFDSAFVFSEAQSDEGSGSVVLVEFKRPDRDDYTESENPITQVYRYMDQIRDGSARQRNGRRFQLRDDVPFFVYIVCDITPRLKTFAKREDFLPCFEGMAYFKYHSSYRAYLEIVSFNKLLSDAKKRNQVFFEKLNLPTN
jgi:hypothetical protein